MSQARIANSSYNPLMSLPEGRDQLFVFERAPEIAAVLSRVKTATGTWAIVMLGSLKTVQRGFSWGT